MLVGLPIGPFANRQQMIINDRSCWRSMMISDYIRHQTGVVRSNRQVSRRLGGLDQRTRVDLGIVTEDQLEVI
ncbi:hypothetical protein BC941DRAFT_512893 [Chlamydoabsidia padenii]|nr:hypothetical protein BC941DRAFT_512893 [Chlamydoabsidia padenii]